MNSRLFIMFPSPAACLYQDKAFGAIDLFLAESPSLAMFNSQVVSCPINEFKGREDFRELPFYCLIERKDIVERRKGKDGVVGSLRCWWG